MADNKEYLKLDSDGLKGKLLNFTGKSGAHWISIIPSLNVSGYGDSEADAINDLKYNLNVFCEDLFKLSQGKRDVVLKNMGWSKNKIFKKMITMLNIKEEFN